MDRRHFLKKSIISTAVGVALPSIPLLADDVSKITVLHTNDTHSRIDPFPMDGGKFAGLGGVARRAALIEKIRKEESHVLLLDAGDIFQGTPYFNFYGGELELKLMSKMKYDAATMGNHDFDAGLEGFIKQLPHANFPFLVSNYIFEEDILKEKVQNYQIFKKGKLKIGVFGLGIEMEGLIPKKLYKNTKYLDPINRAKEMVQELQNKKCDLIICLSHLGYQYERSHKVSDRIIAKEVSGIDLIIGGHTHTFIEKPIETYSSEGSKILINQVGWAGINLGRIDFYFSRNSKKAKGLALKI